MQGLPLQSLLFVIGLVVLTLGAKWMVTGASNLAVRLGIRPIVIGLTVVAFGTSAPELVVSVIAAIQDNTDVAIGNVVGSNIANVGLIVGLTALVLPITSDRSFLKLDMPFMFGAMAALYLVSIDNIIGRIDGVILLILLVLFNLIAYKTAGKRGKAAGEEASEKKSMPWAIALAVIGLAGLTVGAQMMVGSAVQIARSFNISELVIGATIVAIGTSLPELATSLVAVLKKQAAIGLGNVIGSNVFNVCSILGIAPLIRPLPVGREVLVFQYPIMIGFSAALLLTMLKKSNRITRPEGAILFAGFIGFLVLAFFTG